jgi:hypothetical protein
MDILRLVFGVLLLAFGRRLFWLFVGIVGFIAGADLVIRLLPDLPQTVVIVIALVVGLIAAGLAIFIRKIALAIAGFFIGGYLLTALLEMFQINVGGLSWLPYIIGGIIGVILVSLIIDWALIILSSLAGATIILQALQVGPPLQALGLVGLTLVGILIQAGMLRRRPVRRTR